MDTHMDTAAQTTISADAIIGSIGSGSVTASTTGASAMAGTAAGAPPAEAAPPRKDAAADAQERQNQEAEREAAEPAQEASADARTAQPEEPAPPGKAPDEAPKQKPDADAAAMRAQVIDAELRAAAALAGVPAYRVAYVTRLADRSAAEDADPARYAQAQVQQILTDFPELLQQPPGTGSAGNHARQEGRADADTEAILNGFNQRF